MEEFGEKLRVEGYGEWPAVFQVVLKIRSSDGYGMAARYERHVVLQWQGGGRRESVGASLTRTGAALMLGLNVFKSHVEVRRDAPTDL